MEMAKTKKGTKKFIKSEKLRIIEEVKSNGLKINLAKYDLYAATFYHCKKKFTLS